MDDLRAFMVQRRAELRLSQADLAEAAGVSSGTVAAIEIGNVTRSPRGDTLTKLAKGLRVAPEVLDRIARGEGAKPEPKGPRLTPEEYREAVDALLALPREALQEELDHLLYLRHKYQQRQQEGP